MKDNSKTNLDAINILKGIAYSQLEVRIDLSSYRIRGRDLSVQVTLMRWKCLGRLIAK